MLRYNEARSQPVHVLHALSAGVHVLCCGAPLVAQLIGLGVVAGGAAIAHAWLHGYEWLVLLVSGLLLATGVAIEWRSKQAQFRPSPLLYASALCFGANMVVYGFHGLPAL